jgi:NAD-dependent deacetylase
MIPDFSSLKEKERFFQGFTDEQKIEALWDRAECI